MLQPRLRRHASRIPKLVLATVVLLTSPCAWAGTWTSLPSLDQHRLGHTATLLATGELLVCGGVEDDNGDPPTNTCVVLEPGTLRWRPGPSMATGRWHHTATRVGDGRVLICGGWTTGMGSPTGSCEILDPVTWVWSAADDLLVPRVFHTANLLIDGEVLVAGGQDSSAALASGELWTPDSGGGSWQLTNPMNAARHHHTATLLSGGVVFIVGGADHFVASGDADDQLDPSPLTLCDQFVGSSFWGWHAGHLPEPRQSHVAIASINTDYPDYPEIYIVGGWNGTTGVATTWKYHWPDGWTQISDSMQTDRFDHSAVLMPGEEALVVFGHQSIPSGTGNAAGCELFDLTSEAMLNLSPEHSSRSMTTSTVMADGSVVVAGGDVSWYDEALRYTPNQHSWSEATPHPNHSPYWHGPSVSLLPDGKVMTCGGWNTEPEPDDFSGECWAYDPGTDTWSAMPSLQIGRFFHTATLLVDGRVLVAGGMYSQNGNLTSCELFDGVSWSDTSDLLSWKSEHEAIVLPDGRVLVAGGYGTMTQIFDPVSELWSAAGSLSTITREGHLTLLADARVLATSTWGESTAAELFDPITLTWTPTTPMNEPETGHVANLLPDGTVLVSGGGSLTSCELYDPVTETWSYTGSLHQPSYPGRNASTVLNDDRILFIGSHRDTPSERFAEIYDPSSRQWTVDSTFTDLPDTFVPSEAFPLSDGSVLFPSNGGTSQFLVFVPASVGEVNRPQIDDLATSETLETGSPFTVVGDGFLWWRDTGDGTGRSSPSNLASFSLRSVQTGQLAPMAGGAASWDGTDPDPMTVELQYPPQALDAGWYQLVAVTGGVASEPKLVTVDCAARLIDIHPESVVADVGDVVSFNVTSTYGRWFQWQYCSTGNCSTEPEWADIPGATEPVFTTSPVTAPDSGRRYRVEVRGSCYRSGVSCGSQPGGCAVSDPATLTVFDDTSPTAEVLHPAGGEYWLLSDPDAPRNTELITWSMSDDIRICQVDVVLLYSNDGGQTYGCVNNDCYRETGEPLDPSGLPERFGPGAACAYPGETTTSVEYTVPTTPPSGTSGSLYKVQVTVTDHAGNTTTPPVTSANPFYIVQPNPDSVDTLILANLSRMESVMGATVTQTATLSTKLYELADHPRVAGFVVDLGGVTTLSDPATGLYSLWDVDPGNPALANAVLFAPGGIHELLLDLYDIYSGVEHVVLVGDDRIIPFARMPDEAVLFPESNYPSTLPGADLTTTGTTVGQALAADRYLSDDPLVVLDDVAPSDLESDLFIPDLNVGRLVESHEEITTTIATFISQDGVLDLTALDATTGHKVLVSGYDFLVDSARQVRSRWKAALGITTPDDSVEPVDGSLVSSTWGLGSVQERRDALFAHLSGNSGDPYAVASLNGHATHYEEGVPGTSAHDIEGLEALKIFGDDDCGNTWAQPIDLAGAVLYSPGCHGGLPVPGTCATDSEHSLDLAQTLLGRGVQAYMANTGYGWGLISGIGYGERLVEIFTEEMTSGGTLAVGEVFSRTKTRYVLESPRLDAYDMKSLMQWTLYGLPMYAVRTDIAPGAMSLFSGPSPKPWDLPAEQLLGEVRVLQDVAYPGEATLPPYLMRLEMHFDLTAPGVYSKKTASGEDITGTPGCPDPLPDEPEGCYYTLNGLVERGSGDTDIPIQPYLIFDSRMSGTSQHGVLWMGGEYFEETGWVPVIGELASNGGDGSNHGSAPRKMPSRPVGTTVVGGPDPEDCRPSDLELNGLVVLAGEAVREQQSLTYDIERTYRGIDLEVFYFNNTYDGSGNCDRDGPLIGDGPFVGHHHLLTNDTLEWAVPVTDTAGVWRVLVVYSDNTTNGSDYGTWTPVDLVDDGTGMWRTSMDFSSLDLLTYVVQAVDNHGNVTWLEYQATTPAASGVDLGVPLPVDVDRSLIFADGFESGNTSAWSVAAP